MLTVKSDILIIYDESKLPRTVKLCAGQNDEKSVITKKITLFISFNLVCHNLEFLSQ